MVYSKKQNPTFYQREGMRGGYRMYKQNMTYLKMIANELDIGS